MLTVLYASTVFLSAFLLFQIQPVIARAILPWFGGSTAVWGACIVFFQLVLLLGYLYAHLSVKYLRPRTQAGVHAALLLVSLAFLPIMPADFALSIPSSCVRRRSASKAAIS